MKFLLLLLFSVNLFANPNIEEIRKLYPTVANSENQVTYFVSKLADVTDHGDMTFVAYKGASLVMVSKYAKSVLVKMSSCKDGAKLIEKSVAIEPNNIEVRLIRLSVQENVPAIVNYRQNKEEDKAFLLKHYLEQSDVLREYLINFMLQSKSLSEAEKRSIQP